MIDRKISELFGDLGIKMCDKRRSEQILFFMRFRSYTFKIRNEQNIKIKYRGDGNGAYIGA